jgi:beta-aspartyl-peptidase (threonine type)
MADSTTSPSNEPRFRNNFFLVGCLANLLVFAVLIAICAIFLYSIARNLDTSPPAFDERAIQRVLDDQAAAWNRGDLDGFMDGYWRDEKLTFTSKDKVTHGWEATRQNYITRYKANTQGMGKLSFTDLEIESLTPTVALVRGQYNLLRRADKDTGRFTLVFRKFAEGWKITSDHTSAADKREEKD